MMTTYGHQATSAKDRFIEVAEIVREHAESRPGFALVDLFPARTSEVESSMIFTCMLTCSPVKYLPAWFPGASFHRQAAVERALSVRMRSEPYQDVKERMVRSSCSREHMSAHTCVRQATGGVVSCLATRLLAQDDLPWEGTGLTKDEFVRDCCGDVYSGE